MPTRDLPRAVPEGSRCSVLPPHHRSWAAGVWSRLKKLPAAKQALVAGATAHDDRCWALAERPQWGRFEDRCPILPPGAFPSLPIRALSVTGRGSSPAGSVLR